jgi:hypothetical protein
MADKDKIEDRRVRFRPNAAQLFGQIVARLSTLPVCCRYYSKIRSHRFRVFVMNDWMKQRDLLLEEALAFAQSVAANTQKIALTPVHQPDAAQDSALSAQRPVAVTEPAPTDTPDMERIAILRQVANFKAHQQRFQREREDYFQNTMAQARSAQWIPESRDKR